MDSTLINPFIDSVRNVLGTMAQTEAVAGKPKLKSNTLTWGVVTGVIGMAGDDVNGNMILSFDEASILSVVSLMLGEEVPAVNQDVIDAVGELTNMICGGTKSRLSELGIKIHMATPLVIVGRDLELSQLTKAPVITVPFTTPAGTFVIEANLVKR